MSPPPPIFECLLERSSPKERLVPFTRAIIDLTSMFPQKRRNGGTAVGYSGRAASRKELSITYYIDILLCATMVIQFLTSDVTHCTKLRSSTLHNFGTEASFNNQLKKTLHNYIM
jgi:hypothetical protein